MRRNKPSTAWMDIKEESYQTRWLKAERDVLIAEYKYPVWRNHIEFEPWLGELGVV